MGFRSIAFIVAVAAFLIAPTAARADTKSVRDPRDASGRLDIRSASHGHAGANVVHTLVTHGSWSSSVLGGSNAAVFVLDTNNNWRDKPERFVVVFWQGGRLRAVLANKSGRVLRQVRASRPSASSLRVTIPTRALGGKGYRWFAATFDGSAQDFAPNRGTPLHDFTPPVAKLTVPGVPQSTNAGLAVSVSDAGFSGLRSWRLEHRPFGGGAWTALATGTRPVRRTVSLAGAEGASYELRLVAVDKQGNRSVAPGTLSFPRDDRHPSIVYSGTWTQEPFADAFLGTITRSDDSGPSQAFSYTFTGSYVAIVGSGWCGWGQVSIDGQPVSGFKQLCDGERRALLFARTIPQGEHTLTFEVGGGPVVLDGIISR